MVAGAVVGGSAVVGAVASDRAASKSAEATERGAETSAEAQVQATQLQVDEIGRQFDYQQRVLQPQIERQYGAQGAFSNLMGVETPSLDFGGGGEPSAAPAGQAQTGPGVKSRYRSTDGGEGVPGGYRRTVPADQFVESTSEQGQIYADSPQRMGQPDSSQDQSQTDFSRGAQGEFIDPNLDPTRLAETQQLTGQVEGSRLAPTDPDADPYRNYIAGNQIAAPSVEEDARFQRARDVTLAEGAAGTGVYGEEFEESPGYDFQVEEMNRALDRRDSAGGNFGGRAVMEAQRRAQGLAQGDYYNWAQGRTMDLQRQAQAEAQDIQRGDVAVDAYEQQRIADVGRGDTAYENYLARQGQDTARMDAAVGEQDRLRGVDMQRRDQGYYNYINALAQQAGFGNPASQAVQASQSAGAQTAGAYAQQGSGLSQIYGNLGAQQAQIEQNRYANINNAAQSGSQNWMMYQMMM